MSNMDDLFKAQLSANGSNFKGSLERIIEKYSKLQYQDGGVEVDLGSTTPQILERYMNSCRAEISKLESKSLTDLREESIGADVTRDSQLDFTYEDGVADETRVSSTQLSAQDDGMSTNDSTGLTASSPDESSRNTSATEVQPEDRDEELEMSLRSRGSSLLELYPDMIGRIGRAWRRQHVSEAAGSVLRRYRRWRQQSGRGSLGNTFVIALRRAGRYPENDTSQTPPPEEEEEAEAEAEESRNSPKKRQFIGDETNARSPLRRVNNVQQQSPRRVNSVQQQSPWRVNSVQQQSPKMVNSVQQQSPKMVNNVQQQSPRRVNSVQQQSPWRVNNVQQQSPWRVNSVQQQSPWRVNSVQQQSPRRVNNVQQQSPRRVNNVQQQSPWRVNSVQQQSPRRVNNVQQQSPWRVNNVQQQSPWRVRREQHQPVLVMDFSGPSETFMPSESSLNETFSVSEESRLGDRPSACTASPSRPYRPATEAPTHPSFSSRRLSLAHSLQADLYPTAYASENGEERQDVYGSPVKQSPSHARRRMMMETSIGRSPQGYPRSPKTYSGESFSREPSRPRLISTPPHKPDVPLRMLHPQDTHHSLHPQLHSPQLAAAAAAGRRHGLRRHLSFDSSLPAIRVSDSPKKLDEDFLKLYHKFVCQNKSSFFNRHPCRLCARSSEASRGPSSLSLAALALSPHRSLLRKRHRELDRDGHPRSKRYRDERCPSSPGSQRHGKEMLRRRFSTSECGVSFSARKPAVFQRRAADAREEALDGSARPRVCSRSLWDGKFI
ncbi:muscle M-line assembly protein unc-89 isoform X2 [Cyclopterus lumpus]|uniref:muscle M-line assembly protein unc-89 isoform X2 n=1 Tax=Cyclopterus lumpus TaxID=8103 RepID=UPI0014869F47|nr:muscle M-line assembly protein unc-89 isoform X2 [Cyclopterus lumpus]